MRLSAPGTAQLAGYDVERVRESSSNLLIEERVKMVPAKGLEPLTP